MKVNIKRKLKYLFCNHSYHEKYICAKCGYDPVSPPIIEAIFTIIVLGIIFIVGSITSPFRRK